MAKWRKLGRVFCPDGTRDWMRTHAANPIAIPLDGHRVRIFFSARDASNRASIGWIEVDLRRPLQVIAVSATPVIGPGPVGAFDDSGASAGCVVQAEGTTWLFYTGWNLGVTVPWRNSIGLAASTDGVRFERVSPAPVLDRNRVDPFSISYPFVRREPDQWRMWYGSNLRWGTERADMDHVIKYAVGRSADAWEPTGRIAVGIEQPGEYAFSRPCVVHDSGLWKMWYSFRGSEYRIGYAESTDGVVWTRRDARAGIEPSATGWDSESIEYPWVFDHRGERYLLYNGNRYGLTGMGIAVLDRD